MEAVVDKIICEIALTCQVIENPSGISKNYLIDLSLANYQNWGEMYYLVVLVTLNILLIRTIAFY